MLIYGDLSSLKNLESDAISGTLARELAPNSEEIHFLQTSEPSNVLLPRLLFSFHRYSNIGNVHSLHALFSDQDFTSNNFCALNKINESSWKNAKFIITCREGDLEFVKQRVLIFAPLSSGSSELSSVPGSFLQMKIEPFEDPNHLLPEKASVFELFCCCEWRIRSTTCIEILIMESGRKV